MKYEGYKIGPVIRNVRKGKGLLLDDVATKTGISVSTLGQVEQGGRNLSMKNLYMLMDVYETDANTLLAIDATSDSLDSKLRELPVDKQEYLRKTFNFMIECQTAHCGRSKPHIDFCEYISPIVPYRNLPQTLRGLTADCCSPV